MCYAMEEEKRKVKDGASYEFVKKCCEGGSEDEDDGYNDGDDNTHTVSSDACPSVMTLLEKMQTTPSLQHAPIKQLNLHVYMVRSVLVCIKTCCYIAFDINYCNAF